MLCNINFGAFLFFTAFRKFTPVAMFHMMRLQFVEYFPEYQEFVVTICASGTVKERVC